ncbi:hypothetical protein L249_4870 [Ophiocordyceps polyrhachis-furcata BCC 54312]|uniref:Uncharacterized protein n=1 Tax=Ophiocordyceps polyrhachis-furcata BCC 54312 TaxID=1330021 RepID=A0A367L2I7_9HYPO|nr:hypothetical protein L249_4870 [Ophiocordyceps polyrhachis-furcata BCC 54312]
MYHTYGVLTPDTLPPYDAYAADNMPVSQKKRPGQSMRINKPSSANSSPRSSGRRRTFVVDTLQRQMMDYLSIPCSIGHRQHHHHHHHRQHQHHDPPKQSFRPMSWHPSSYMQPQRTAGYPLPIGLHTTADSYDMSCSGQPDFSPMMAASYSNDTSPCSTFSPLPLFTDCSRPDGWDFPQRATPLYTPTSSDMSEPFLAATQQQQQQQQQQQRALAPDWDTFVMQGYDATSPPTPENPPAMQSQEPAVPYQTQAEEEEGEILVGMGLYDGPEKQLDEDPQLNNYRSTVSCLLGSSLRPLEPRGKGLKLEETWEPPRCEDDNDEDPPSDEESV